jgi:RND family efflux transporter MFP subunit
VKNEVIAAMITNAKTTDRHLTKPIDAVMLTASAWIVTKALLGITLCMISANSMANAGAELFGNHISSGVVIPNRIVTLSAKIIGRVTQSTYQEGQTVRQGETLVVMDDTELRADLAYAQAFLTLEKIKLEYRKLSESRMTQLSVAHSVSDEQIEKVKFDYALAKENVRAAEAQVAKIKAILKETTLVAPFDAVITFKQAEVGQLTQPGERMFVLEDHSQYKFRMKVSEQDIATLAIGQTVQVVIDALGHLALSASIDKIIPSGDAKHTFVVEVALPTDPELKNGFRLLPGMFGKVSIPVDNHDHE